MRSFVAPREEDKCTKAKRTICSKVSSGGMHRCRSSVVSHGRWPYSGVGVLALSALWGTSLFRTWFAMYERCAVCGLRFEREQGYFLGAMYINYGVTVVLALLGSLRWSTGRSRP